MLKNGKTSESRGVDIATGGNSQSRNIKIL
jgi:hypothetical protein